MDQDCQILTDVHIAVLLRSGTLRKPLQNIIESTSKKGPCCPIIMHSSMYPTYSFHFILNLCSILSQSIPTFTQSYQLHMKSHKHTFSAITLSNINIFFVSSYGGCEVGGFMFAKVHKSVQKDLDLHLDTCITHASSVCFCEHTVQVYVCECISFRFPFLNLPFEMKVTKELHLLSLGQRVCILLYAYGI